MAHENHRNPSGRGAAGFEIHVDRVGSAARAALGRLHPEATLRIAEIVAQPIPSRLALLARRNRANSFRTMRAGQGPLALTPGTRRSDACERRGRPG